MLHTMINGMVKGKKKIVNWELQLNAKQQHVAFLKKIIQITYTHTTKCWKFNWMVTVQEDASKLKAWDSSHKFLTN